MFAASSGTLPFFALCLLRIVTRLTGLPARAFDTVVILGFSDFSMNLAIGEHRKEASSAQNIA